MESHDRIERRQLERRRRQLRRRRLALGALAVAVVAVVVGVVAAGGSGGGSKPAASTGAAAAGARGSARPAASAPSGAIAASAPGAHRAPTERVAILMYHVIGHLRPGISQAELWVSPDDFRAQMRALAKQGYHGVTLQQVWDAWHRGKLLPSKPIVVSFDDGYTGQWRDARPILRERGWPGVLNLELKNLGDVPPWQIRQLIQAGWEIDSHTIDHPDLTTVSDDQLRRELVDSKAEIRRRFGLPANFFCYPAGRFDARVVAAVRAAGYLAATTTQLGVAGPDQPPFELPRVRVNGSDGVSGLQKQLAQASGGAGAGVNQGE